MKMKWSTWGLEDNREGECHCKRVAHFHKLSLSKVLVLKLCTQNLKGLKKTWSFWSKKY